MFTQINDPMFEKKLSTAIQRVLEPLLVSCEVCKNVGDIKKCSACKELLYCSVQCQRKAWKEHKQVCKKVKVKN